MIGDAPDLRHGGYAPVESGAWGTTVPYDEGYP